jgi:hypothetical protein
MNNELPRFFLGANSPAGFVSRFDNLYFPDEGWFAYILKGGPGTGKSTLMKRAARDAVNANIAAELIHCSSDPDSLDAVIFPEKRLCIVDGTAPHTLDPKYPGVADVIINLGDCWDTAALQQRSEEIIATSRRNSAMHLRSRRYLAAFGSLHNDTMRIAGESVCSDKVADTAASLSKKLFGGKAKQRGKEQVRLLGAITPEGWVTLEETIALLCETIYFIEDEFDSVGGRFLGYLRDAALDAGFDVIASYSPIAPLSQLDALLVPECGVAFAVSNSWHPLNLIKPRRTIHARRFQNSEAFAGRKQRLSFNRKTERMLLTEAVASLHHAKCIHDTLEALYAQCMDYRQVDLIYEALILDIIDHPSN